MALTPERRLVMPASYTRSQSVSIRAYSKRHCSETHKIPCFTASAESKIADTLFGTVLSRVGTVRSCRIPGIEPQRRRLLVGPHPFGEEVSRVRHITDAQMPALLSGFAHQTGTNTLTAFHNHA